MDDKGTRRGGAVGEIDRIAGRGVVDEETASGSDAHAAGADIEFVVAALLCESREGKFLGTSFHEASAAVEVEGACDENRRGVRFDGSIRGGEDHIVGDGQQRRAAVAQTEALIERLVVRAPRAATVLQVNTRPGEFVAPGASRSPLVLGDLAYFQVRADVDEQVAPRVRPNMKAVGYVKGDTQRPIALEFVRVEPYIVPKTSLTGSSVERVDTRVLQIIYRFPRTAQTGIYVGQQLDLYLEEAR
ncbi:MAG: HlyD family efflux transporter periplasmic adaptor subunit [Clostridia bacterium]|nr:HlyD family efflux transporter periplasmic adaptor subunit [Clostridia bacterium]